MATKTRELTGNEIARLAKGDHLSFAGRITCEGDTGSGPCGRHVDWHDGICAHGHMIMVVVTPSDRHPYGGGKR